MPKVILSQHHRNRYPRQLSAGANNAVVALSETEAGKLFGGDTRSDIGSEAEKMKYANGMNGLVVKFVRLDVHKALEKEMLVMEWLYPIGYRAFETEKRALWFEAFEDELQARHSKGFVHCGLRRPSGPGSQHFGNILLTHTGLRLIDTGISALQHQVGNDLFQRYIAAELQELQEFKTYFLNR